MGKIIKNLILCLILFFIINNNFSYAENLDNLNKKLYLLQNPENGVQRIVDDSGKTIIKTESGIFDSDYNYYDIRQEKLDFLNVDGYNVIFKETKYEMKMYDQDGNYITNNLTYHPQIRYLDGKLLYKTNKYKYEIYEYDVITKENKFVRESNGNDMSLLQDEINAINKENTNENVPNIIYSFNKDEYNNGPISEKESDEIFGNDNFSIKKTDEYYIFESKTSSAKIENVKSYKEYDSSYNNLKMYELETDNIKYYVNEEGKIILSSFNDKREFAFSHKRFSFVNNKYIIIEGHFVSEDNREESIMIYEHDENNQEEVKEITTDYNVKVVDGEYIYEDVKDETIFTVFGEFVRGIHNINWYNIKNIENKLYLMVSEGNWDNLSKTVYNFADNIPECNDVIFYDEFILIKENDKIYLYNVRGEIIERNIDKFLLIPIRDRYCYGKLRQNSIMVMKNGKYEIVKNDGSVFLSNLDLRQINSDVDSYPNNSNEEYLLAKANGVINFYDRDGKKVFSGIDDFDFDSFKRHGNYFVAIKNGEKSLYSIKGNKIIKNIEVDVSDKITQIYENEYSHRSLEVNNMWVKKANSKKIRFNDINGNLCIELNGKYHLYDIDGNILLFDYKFLRQYDDTYLLYEKGFEYGLIDEKGNVKFKYSIFDGTNYDE